MSMDKTQAHLRRVFGEAAMANDTTPSPHRVIRASAGSGKTYQLTARYLRLIRAGETPEHILATTFTRKAAGEIVQRVFGWLARAARDDAERTSLAGALGGYPLSRADCIAMLRRTVTALHRLNIGTIDSFFNAAASAMRFELDLPIDPRLTDEGSPLARQLRHDAIARVLEDAAADDDSFRALIEMLRRLHHDTAQRSVTQAIDDIVAQGYSTFQQHPERGLWHSINPPAALDEATLPLAVEALAALGDDMPITKAGKPRSNWTKAHNALVAAASRGDFKTYFAHTLVQRVVDDAQESSFDRIEIPTNWADGIRPLAWHARAVMLGQLAQQTEATYALLHAFSQHYGSLLHDHRVLLFSDLTHLLAKALPNAGAEALEDLYFRLDTRVTHLLLDEFQDTSLDQWQVLEPFALEIAAAADGSRSLLCVGDVKQAIYGWRGGCAELFNQVESLPGLSGQAVESLAVSRRSSPIVLDAVNQVFSNLSQCGALADWTAPAHVWQERYETHKAFAELPGHVTMRTTEPEPEDAEAGDDDMPVAHNAHAAYVAASVKQLLADEPGCTIGVLVRRRKAAGPLIYELKKLGVAVSQEGGNPIDNVPAVSAVLSAMRLADHPGDKAARFHVANSPIGEVLGLSGTQGAEAKEVSGRILREVLDHGYAKTIGRWTRALAVSCDERSLRRLTQLVEFAQEFEADAGLRPSAFVEAARSARVEEVAPAAARVMTIHGAKGLEFDCVVLPDLTGRLTSGDARRLVVIDRPTPLDEPKAIVRRPGKATLASIPDLAAAAQREDELRRQEDFCLLYVAMTRARHALHLMVPPLKRNKSGLSSVGANDVSFAAILRQTLGEHVEAGEGDELLFERGEPGWSSHLKQIKSAPYTDGHASAPAINLAKSGTPRRSWSRTAPSSLHDAGSVEAADLLGSHDSGGRHFGSVIHAMFECVGFVDGAADPTDAELDAAVLSIEPGANEAARERYRTTLRQSIADETIRAALRSSGADTLWRERPFVIRLDGQLLRGTFDRVAIHHDKGMPSRTVLIDYKTDRLGDGDTQAITDRYRGQIDAYRQALCAMLGIEATQVEAKLLLVQEARLIDL